MYYRYHNELGLNTLSEKYEEDILRLPESAETPGVAAADSERKPSADCKPAAKAGGKG